MTLMINLKLYLVKTLVHTGIFDLKIIANNAILLVISISTTFALLGSSKVSNEAKNFKELEFLGLSR